MERRSFFKAIPLILLSPKLALEVAKHIEPIKPRVVYYTGGIVGFINKYGVEVNQEKLHYNTFNKIEQWLLFGEKRRVNPSTHEEGV